MRKEKGKTTKVVSSESKRNLDENGGSLLAQESPNEVSRGDNEIQSKRKSKKYSKIKRYTKVKDSLTGTNKLINFDVTSKNANSEDLLTKKSPGGKRRSKRITQFKIYKESDQFDSHHKDYNLEDSVYKKKRSFVKTKEVIHKGNSINETTKNKKQLKRKLSSSLNSRKVKNLKKGDHQTENIDNISGDENYENETIQEQDSFKRSITHDISKLETSKNRSYKNNKSRLRVVPIKNTGGDDNKNGEEQESDKKNDIKSKLPTRSSQRNSQRNSEVDVSKKTYRNTRKPKKNSHDKNDHTNVGDENNHDNNIDIDDLSSNSESVPLGKIRRYKKNLDRKKETKNCRSNSEKKIKVKTKNSGMKDVDERSNRRNFNLEIDEDDSDTDSKEYEVSKLLDVYFKENGEREFLVRWKGYSAKDDTWEPERHLNCEKLIEKFLTKFQEAKNKSPREMRRNRKITERYMANDKVRRKFSIRLNQGPRKTYYDYN